jgi:hypothetical protein
MTLSCQKHLDPGADGTGLTFQKLPDPGEDGTASYLLS